MIAISRIISQEPFNQNAATSLCNTCALPSDIRHVFTVPLNVLSFSHDLSVDQVLFRVSGLFFFSLSPRFSLSLFCYVVLPFVLLYSFRQSIVILLNP